MAQRYFATIEPGLEEALLAEVRALGGKRAKALRGGVEFDATHPVFYSAAAQLRCANRLWLRVDEFRARDAPELFNKTRRIEWQRLLPPNAALEVRAAAAASKLIHTGMIAGTVANAVAEAIGHPRVGGRKFILLARLQDDRCELSLDASGELLYRRGWKEDVGEAPLRESVAACLLRLSGWEPGQPVFDPMCGSGTFVIEAAQQSAGIAAGASREHAFHDWANFRPDLWREVIETSISAEPPPAVHFGADASVEAVERARHNAERAGVAAICDFRQAVVADAAPPVDGPGLLITNPPWNRRVADPEMGALGDFLRVARERFPTWRKLVVVPKNVSTPTGFKRLGSVELGGIPLRIFADG